ncbi:MAG TPA: ATP-binding protein [Phycisphaerae bacterium]|nr:ATP-binding protein [Phycisphaerae bacterium]
MLESLTMLAGWVIAAAVGATAGVLVMHVRGRPVRQVCQRLSRVSGDIQADLAQLQLEDTCGQLGAAWNRLIEEVAAARRDLETLQIRQQARETLNNYEMKWFSQLLNQIPYGLITVADDWLITYANAAAERMLGVSEGGLKGRKATDFFAQDLSHISPSAGIAIDQTSELVSSPKLVRMTAVDALSETERAETALLLQDVTQEREREAERSNFLYHVTHELRTPLTNIRAYAETLSEGVLQDPDTLRECYNVIVGETQRLSRLVEDILSLSQMEAGAARIKMDDVNTSRLVRQIVEDMQAQADEKGVELILSMPPKVPTIRGDKERLAVVLTNIVGNAIKYTPGGGRVEVTCAQESSRLHIKVADTGLGIAPKEREKVFEKFYRSTDERVSGLPGTGLGLALAMEIVRTHGGTITLESEVGKGSTFTVVLPIGNLAAIQT